MRNLDARFAKQGRLTARTRGAARVSAARARMAKSGATNLGRSATKLPVPKNRRTPSTVTKTIEKGSKLRGGKFAWALGAGAAVGVGIGVFKGIRGTTRDMVGVRAREASGWAAYNRTRRGM